MATYHWLGALALVLVLFYVPYTFGLVPQFWLKIAGVAFALIGFVVAFLLGDLTEGKMIRPVALFMLLVGIILILVG